MSGHRSDASNGREPISSAHVGRRYSKSRTSASGTATPSRSTASRCRVDAGELFGLLGPNGAGKTTLITILCGLTDADSGEVEAVRQAVPPRDDRDLRRLVGIGTQDLSIYPDLSARENLRFFGKLYGLGGKDARIARRGSARCGRV